MVGAIPSDMKCIALHRNSISHGLHVYAEAACINMPDTALTAGPSTVSTSPLLLSAFLSSSSIRHADTDLNRPYPTSDRPHHTELHDVMAEPDTNPDSNTEPKVQYVLSGQPTGVAALANAMRKYDQERVQNSKEDIDTLLVFVRIRMVSLFSCSREQ